MSSFTARLYEGIALGMKVGYEVEGLGDGVTVGTHVGETLGAVVDGTTVGVMDGA